MHQYAPQLQQDHRQSVRSMAQLLSTSRFERYGKLVWYDIGVGWYPVSAGIKPYDRAYFERYQRQADSDIGRALMQARVEFVARHYDGFLCDVGIGSGAFIALRGNACGYDVCPAGIEWLRARNLLIDPYRIPMPAMSLWDVLEHIPEFWRLLRNIEQWLFVSLPIFADAKHALQSKHFRPDEHCWYWTRDGLVQMMCCLGFHLVEENDSETKLGREDIGSFAFKKGNSLWS
jgi:hypothetical protein